MPKRALVLSQEIQNRIRFHATKLREIAIECNKESALLLLGHCEHVTFTHFEMPE